MRATGDLSDYLVVYRGDIVINKLVARSGAFGLSPHIGIVSPAYYCYIPGDEADGRYLDYSLHSSLGLAEIWRRSKDLPPNAFDISRSNLATLRVPVPPLEVQRRIADYLDTETARIDTLITKNQQAAGLVEERYLAEVVEEVTGGTEEGEVGIYGSAYWINTSRESWMVAPLGARYRVELGKMLNEERGADPNGRPYLGNANVRWDDFDLTDVNTMTFSDADWPRYGLEPGDVLVCEGGDVGRAAVWDGRLPGMHYQKALHRLRPLHRDQEEPRYLMYALMAAARTGVFAIGSNKATIDHLTSEKLAEHRFPFPPLATQRAIVAQLDHATGRVQRLRATLTHQLSLLRERRQALITAAVTGKMEV